jgi:hypothetical protein
VFSVKDREDSAESVSTFALANFGVLGGHVGCTIQGELWASVGLESQLGNFGARVDFGFGINSAIDSVRALR